MLRSYDLAINKGFRKTQKRSENLVSDRFGVYMISLHSLEFYRVLLCVLLRR